MVIARRSFFVVLLSVFMWVNVYVVPKQVAANGAVVVVEKAMQISSSILAYVLLAGGAGVLVGAVDSDYSPEVKQKAIDLARRAPQYVHDAAIASYNSASAAGAKVMDVADVVKSWIKGAITDIKNAINDANPYSTVVFTSRSTNGGTIKAQNDNLFFVTDRATGATYSGASYLSLKSKNVGVSTTYPSGYAFELGVKFGYSTSYLYAPSSGASAAGDYYNTSLPASSMLSIITANFTVFIGTQAQWDLRVTTNKDVVSPSVDNALSLGGGKVYAPPISSFAPSVDGMTATWDASLGKWKLPDGSIVDALPNSLPRVNVSDGQTVVTDTVVNPDGSITTTETGAIGSGVGDSTSTTTTDETAPPVEEVPPSDGTYPWLDTIVGWLNAIVSWLKGIWTLIKGLAVEIAGAIGAALVPATPVSEQFAPFVDDLSAKFNTPADFEFLKGQISGTCGNMNNLRANVMGQELVIVKFDEAKKWASWWMPIMKGFMWFGFGFWLYRKAIAMAGKNGNGGVNW